MLPLTVGSGVGGRGAGDASAPPKSFDLVKIREKMAPNTWRITWRPFFGGHPKNGRHEKLFAQKVVHNFFGQVWENLGKNPSHPQKFACSYTYVSGYRDTEPHKHSEKACWRLDFAFTMYWL